MMEEMLGMSMSRLSSGPINAAWMVLKNQQSLGNLTPEDQHVIQQYFNNLSPQEQEAIQHFSSMYSHMDPEIQQQINSHIEEIAEPYIGNMSSLVNHMEGQPLFNFSSNGNEGKVAKIAFLPLAAVGLTTLFTVDAVNRSQGADGSIVAEGLKTTYNHTVAPAFGTDTMETDWDSVTSGYDDARYIEPIFGTQLGGDIENPSFWDRLKTGSFAALTAVNPFAWLRNASAGARMGGRGATRAVANPVGRRLTSSGEKRIATLAEQQAAKVYPKTLAGQSERARQRYTGPGAQNIRTNLGGKLQGAGHLTKPKGMTDEAWDAMNAAQKRGFRLTGHPIGRGLQAVGPLLEAGLNVPALFAPAVAGQLDFQPNTSGFDSFGGYGSGGLAAANVGGPAGGFATAHQVHGVGDQSGAQTKREAVWEPEEGSSFEQQQEFTGFKGENMEIGDRMLKELTEMMYKAKCPKCGKVNCNCKEYKNKEDDKKKPAHGMVIVIGTKAGPGPSTDGKRDKLDSEKDKKDE